MVRRQGEKQRPVRSSPPRPFRPICHLHLAHSLSRGWRSELLIFVHLLSRKPLSSTNGTTRSFETDQPKQPFKKKVEMMRARRLQVARASMGDARLAGRRRQCSGRRGRSAVPSR